MSESVLPPDRLSMQEASREVDVHSSTLWRWCTRGIRGRLPSFRVGMKRYVRRIDLADFVEWYHGADDELPPEDDTPDIPQQNRASRELEAEIG